MLTAILAVAALLSLVSAVLFQAPGLLGREKVPTDFDSFYVAGLMANRDEAANAYRVAEMLEAQEAFSGTRRFMPWTYPPPFTLLVKALARMPIGYAYMLFVWASFVFYLLVLRRIAGRYLPGTLIAILPVVVLTVRTGQNGFLTAGLIGSFLLVLGRGSSSAGVPLGLMVIKPHLAAGVALLAVLERRWKIIAVAGGSAAMAMVLATIAFGISIWAAFFDGVREAGEFLTKGYYPLYRMTSVYAFVRSCGAPASVAFVLHTIVALGGIGLFFEVWRRRSEGGLVAAAACVTTLLVSPYSYDYDLAVLGIGIAFVLPALIVRARPPELLGLMLLAWIATGYGLGIRTYLESSSNVVSSLQADNQLSLGAPAVILLVALCSAVLRRPASIESSPAESTAIG